MLAQHPTVRQAVITAGEDSPATSAGRLLVATEEKEGTVAALRTFLKEKLPDYMVPAAFVFLGSLPLTAMGKLDRRALPAPGTESPDSMMLLSRRGTLSKQCWRRFGAKCAAWRASVVRDNFFDLGGQSLRATQAVFRTRDALNVELPLQSFSRRRRSPVGGGADASARRATADRKNAQLLLEVAQLSEEEAQKMLDENFADSLYLAFADRCCMKKANFIGG